MFESENITIEDLIHDSIYCHQFATLVFERHEDAKQCLITIVTFEGTKVILGDNKYNPSDRRKGTSIYMYLEDDLEDIFKISIFQHKGLTLIKKNKVSSEELNYFFNKEFIESLGSNFCQ